MVTKEKLIRDYKVHESWTDDIAKLLLSEKSEALKDRLSKTFVPAKYNVFKAFSLGKKDAKVILVGQDPYCGPNAMGLSFAIPKDATLTPSLRIISKELERSGYKSISEGERRMLI